mmetsp:Transcript_25547/g.35862  ORF Transcript_25547/g.35862 Transcript_25547/m.35862 type:complete len:232 (+) Transcript_25547:1378-2073(+)
MVLCSMASFTRELWTFLPWPTVATFSMVSRVSLAISNSYRVLLSCAGFNTKLWCLAILHRCCSAGGMPVMPASVSLRLWRDPLSDTVNGKVSVVSCWRHLTLTVILWPVPSHGMVLISTEFQNNRTAFSLRSRDSIATVLREVSSVRSTERYTWRVPVRSTNSVTLRIAGSMPCWLHSSTTLSRRTDRGCLLSTVICLLWITLAGGETTLGGSGLASADWLLVVSCGGGVG